jgi:dTDP-4-amino-4,6-dideoxygalactose transaminase
LKDSDIALPEVPSWADPVWHLFVIQSEARDQLQNYLTNKGVGTMIHYPIPPHLQPAYQELGYREGNFPIAETLSRTVLSLPIGPHISSQSAKEIVALLRKFNPS